MFFIATMRFGHLTVSPGHWACLRLFPTPARGPAPISGEGQQTSNGHNGHELGWVPGALQSLVFPSAIIWPGCSLMFCGEGFQLPPQHRQWTLRMFSWLFLSRVVHTRQRRGLCTKGAVNAYAASASGAASLQSEGVHSEEGTVPV